MQCHAIVHIIIMSYYDIVVVDIVTCLYCEKVHWSHVQRTIVVGVLTLKLVSSPAADPPNKSARKKGEGGSGT